MNAILKQLAVGLVIGSVALCASAASPASRPASGPAASSPSPRLVRPSEDRPVQSGPKDAWSQWARTLAALALVVVLIVIARLMLKRFGPVSGARRRDMLDVLARTAVSSKHQLLLVRVGRRVVLVGQAPGGLTALSEVTQPDEVAALIEAASTDVGLKKLADKAQDREGDA